MPTAPARTARHSLPPFVGAAAGTFAALCAPMLLARATGPTADVAAAASHDAAPVLAGAGVWLAALAAGHLLAVRWTTPRCPAGRAVVAGVGAAALLLAAALLAGARLTETLGAAGFVAGSTAFAVAAGAGATQLAADAARTRRRPRATTPGSPAVAR
jgi:hypothetical protein